MLAILLLGLALGLDSFRVSLGLGLLRLPFRRRLAIAVAFGLCDGLSPLAGFAIGRLLVDRVSAWTDWLGPLVLCLYGIYMVVVARLPEGDERQARWVLGLPVVLSLDNLVAGVGLGALGFPVWGSAAVLGLASGVLAWAGLSVGASAARYLPRAAALGGGAVMIAVGVVEGLRNRGVP
ncbi:MAG TPA: manganese efflux pump [Gemmatimonadales bacterium]|jgi:putative Mn2+ efflux pump MntP|nr:manganese efflux pump [Gemmatimonadales bacterium]